ARRGIPGRACGGAGEDRERGAGQRESEKARKREGGSSLIVAQQWTRHSEKSSSGGSFAFSLSRFLALRRQDRPLTGVPRQVAQRPRAVLAVVEQEHPA